MSIDLYAQRWDEPEIQDTFALAADRVQADCGTVDGGLLEARLDTNRAIRALMRACYNAEIALNIEDDLSPAQIQHIATHARFPEDEEPWAALSARAFITTCAELGLGAYFA